MSASKFTPRMRAGLLRELADGTTLIGACKAVGISESTVKAWLSRGRREPEGEYANFALTVELARDAARARARTEMDEDELRLVLSEAARGGSVQAMKLLWEMIRDGRGAGEDEDEEPASDFEALDEVGQARRRRQG